LTKIKRGGALATNRKTLTGGDECPSVHGQRRTYVTPMKVTFCVGLRTMVVPSE